ncbi:MAG: AMP-binding protein [Myxococcota bacterium]
MNVNFKCVLGTKLKTSGSMGVPKVVCHSFEQHLLAAQAVIQNTGLTATSRSLVSLPVHHVSGLAIVVRAWASGGEWVLPPKDWTPSWAFDAGITHLSLVSTQLIRWIKEPVFISALRQMKAITLGGSAIPRSLIEQAYREGLPLITTYGSTETASQVTATALGDSLDRLLTSGRCLPDREIQSAADGEILVRGDMVHQKGWYATGDLGQINNHGYLEVFGRKDNRMISGGENIYPEEIERALLEHPNIEAVIVVPKQDIEYGQRPAAFVKMRSNLEIQPDDLIAFCKERLLGYKVPRFWYAWPEGLAEHQKPSRYAFAKLLN